jgi:hypothetical protein
VAGTHFLRTWFGALSAPGFPASTLTMCDSSLGIGCTIKWGDGSSKPVRADFTVTWP